MSAGIDDYMLRFDPACDGDEGAGVAFSSLNFTPEMENAGRQSLLALDPETIIADLTFEDLRDVYIAMVAAKEKKQKSLACPCMEKIALEVSTTCETNCRRVVPTPSIELATCPLGCWKDLALSPDHLLRQSQLEGLCRWATAGDQIALERVRSLFHWAEYPSLFASPPQKNPEGR